VEIQGERERERERENYLILQMKKLVIIHHCYYDMECYSLMEWNIVQ